MKPIPILDLFAGPGGLGEGFMSVKDHNDNYVYNIKLSIEKDESAHKTLTWRSFYWQFVKNHRPVPEEYYQAYRETDLKKREEIIEAALDKYPEGKLARKEARLVELGGSEWPSYKVDELISTQLGHDSGNWVLIGGPPCQAYSNAGRSRVGGIDKDDHRVYLYKEYLRIIQKHKPAVFVMENVKGLLSAKVGDEKVFDWMKKDLKVNDEYKLHSFVKPDKIDTDFLIKAENYGVPQKRHRVILLGIRKDFEHMGEYLQSKKEKQISLESIIDKLTPVRSALNREFIKHDLDSFNKKGKPKRIYKQLEDTDRLWKDYLSTCPKRIEEWKDLPLNGLSVGVKSFPNGKGGEFVSCDEGIEESHPLSKWYVANDWERRKGLANHESRSHLSQDLMRYLFAGLYVEKYRTFPRLKDYAAHSSELVPDHENVNSGKFTDRFRVQVKDRPATTVTSHISKDGHYFIHYNPGQCRSLTVREAARIQTFPDNYLFRGSRTQQYHQVGNAVPPYLAYQLGRIVRKIIT